jgi:hypothetical protein
MKFVILCVLFFLCSCTSGPQNRVGAAYDADSFYCLNSADDAGRAGVSRPVNPHCEPAASWKARSGSGAANNGLKTKSVFVSLLKRLF